MLADEVHKQLAKIAPIDGVSIGNREDRTTWSLSFKDTATDTQKAEAMRALLAFDPAIAGEEKTDLPWVVYGQEAFAVSVVDDPICNHNGVIGEADLPYTVPVGYDLCITSYGVEAYDVVGTVVLVPWLGMGPPTNAKCLHSCGCGSGSNEVKGFNPILPTGTILHARLMSGEAPRQVCGWYIRGYLKAK